MSVAKVTEIIASSNKSFEDVIENGIKRASKTIKGISSA
jgi:flavin-binding protein dodecin